MSENQGSATAAPYSEQPFSLNVTITVSQHIIAVGVISPSHDLMFLPRSSAKQHSG